MDGGTESGDISREGPDETTGRIEGNAMKIVRAAIAALLFAAPLAACGGGGEDKPAIVEARVEEARLREFLPFFPAPIAGWEKSEPVFATADDKSSVSVPYVTQSGDAYTIQITFSNAEAGKFAALLKDDEARGKAGVTTATFAGTSALSFSDQRLTNAKYLVVASPSRTVSIIHNAGERTQAVMRAAFESVDFGGIGAK